MMKPTTKKNLAALLGNKPAEKPKDAPKSGEEVTRSLQAAHAGSLRLFAKKQ